MTKESNAIERVNMLGNRSTKLSSIYNIVKVTRPTFFSFAKLACLRAIHESGVETELPRKGILQTIKAIDL